MSRKFTFPCSGRRKPLLYAYVGFLGLLSVSVLLMPLGAGILSETALLTYILGVLFWIGLAGTAAMAIWITCARHRSGETEEQEPRWKHLGVLCFFRNRPARVCDIVMLASLVCLAAACIWLSGTVFPFISLSLLIFSFGMHCMLNGRNYTYINNQTRRATKL